MATSRLYQYRQLGQRDHFRLLLLISDATDPRLQCYIEEVSIGNLNRYEYLAMSYTWGAPADKVPIRCGEKEIIMIPRNLYAALHCLAKERWRGVEGTRGPIRYHKWIWADAICIDQSSRDERSQQVKLMRQIYQLASVVMVWLGKQEETDEDLITLLSGLHENLTKAVAGRDPTTIDLVALRDSELVPPAASTDWIRLGNFYLEAWFARKWVIQEVASAKTLMVMKGPQLIPSDAVWQLPELLIKTGLIDMVKAAQLENSLLSRTPHDWKLNGLVQAHFMSVQRVLLRQGPPLTLLELLSRFRDSLATDPEDHIFALVGISSDGDHPVYRPDYRREISEIYHSFAWTTINQYSSLQVLSLAGLQGGKTDVPSWTPDWTVSPQVFAYGMTFPGTFQASGPTKEVITHNADDIEEPEDYKRVYAMLKALSTNPLCPINVATPGYACLSNDGTVLTVLGKQFDAIKEVGTAQTVEEILPHLDQLPAIPPWVRSHWTEEQLQRRWSEMMFGETLHSEAKEMVEHLPFYPNYVAGGTMDNAFWRTWVCNTTFTGGRVPDNFHDNYRSWQAVKAMMTNPEDTYQATMDEHFARQRIFDQVYGTAAAGKRFFTTYQGYIGLAPSMAVPGDVVCILKGATVPFVLRKTADRYILVGECYCHGIMYGEAMRRKDLPIREFSLE